MQPGGCALPIVLAYAEPPAVAAPVPPGPAVITNPDWASKPNGQDVERYYPEGAQKKDLEGRATVRCQVTAGGKLAECAVVAEDPVGEGFGEAALRLSTLFHMRPMTRGGAPVAAGVINIPIRFQLPARLIAPLIKISHPGANGHVDVACRISAELRFDNCRIDRSTSGPALTDLALQVAAKFKLPPTAAVGARVLIPMDFT
jgi:TonB family protein